MIRFLRKKAFFILLAASLIGGAISKADGTSVQERSEKQGVLQSAMGLVVLGLGMIGVTACGKSSSGGSTDTAVSAAIPTLIDAESAISK